MPIGLLLKQVGPRPLAYYAWYQVQLRSGWIARRTPVRRWDEPPLEAWLAKGADRDKASARFLFDRPLAALPVLQQLQTRTEHPVAEVAAQIGEGAFRLFGGEPVPLGFPPAWLQLPLERAATAMSAERHWTAYLNDHSLDLRMLWELSRLGWVYPLARAYLLTQEHRYAEAFFALLNSWQESNPPNRGPNWISAQEVALRIMALSFGWFAFSDRLESDHARRAQLLTMIGVHANRIPPTLSYAKAQRNNHLLSEAAGLYTAGLLFPMLRHAERWKRSGRRLFLRALDDQVFSDGGYIQHSTNYHRLALSLGLWVARLAERNREPLPERSLAVLQRLTRALAALVDRESGGAPNLGSNDGSEVLPLSGCPHSDYRPVVQAASLAFDGQTAFPAGPWDESALWLGLAPASATEPSPAETGAGAASAAAIAAGDRSQIDFPRAGLYLLRGRRSWAALRCARFDSRPSQSDQLQLDLWWNGNNIGRDPGSYRYTRTGLEEAAAHNALTADNQEPMRRVGRFLWLERYPAVYLGRSAGEDSAEGGDATSGSLAAERWLTDRIRHRRSVVHAGDTLWVVIDDLLGSGEHQARLAWLLPDGEWDLKGEQLSLATEIDQLTLRIEPAQVQLALYRAGGQVAGDPAPNAEADESPDRVGWWAPSYGRRQPGLSLVARLRGPLPLRIASWWQLGQPDPSLASADGPLAEFLNDAD